jgi:hypothetical protein
VGHGRAHVSGLFHGRDLRLCRDEASICDEVSGKWFFDQEDLNTGDLVTSVAVAGRFDLAADAQWSVLEPLLPKGRKSGRPPKWTKRQSTKAVLICRPHTTVHGSKFRTRTLGEESEPSFDLVEPGRAGRGEVQVDAGCLARLRSQGLVGAVVSGPSGTVLSMWPGTS